MSVREATARRLVTWLERSYHIARPEAWVMVRSLTPAELTAGVGASLATAWRPRAVVGRSPKAQEMRRYHAQRRARGACLECARPSLQSRCGRCAEQRRVAA